MNSKDITSSININQIIFMIRGQKVMLSTDLAKLYRVEPKVLLQAVKRNLIRFPIDFMFQLTRQEYQSLKSQFVTLQKSPRAVPYAFTEQGVAMLSSVLRSDQAIKVNIEIMRAFVTMRKFLLTNAELSKKIATLENEYDAQFKVVFDALRQLMNPSEESTKSSIGFNTQ